ncbi:MAG: hypothetical protein LWY06_00005 [Firmicutes bacterium]|nr:hypothetical protein [Bacillota bacterium]
MKKILVSLLMLVVLCTAAHAETVNISKCGMSLNPPAGFKQGDITQTPVSCAVDFNGPMKGSRNWRFMISAVQTPKVSTPAEIGKASLKSIAPGRMFVKATPVKIKGADASYLLTPDLKKSGSILYKVTIYSKNFCYDIDFFGDEKTQAEYEKVIVDMLKTITIK